MNAYIDIDGVLLGKFGNEIVLAEGAEELVDFLLEHYFVCNYLCEGQK